MYFKILHPFTPKAAGVVEKSVVTCISMLHLIAFQFFFNKHEAYKCSIDYFTHKLLNYFTMIISHKYKFIFIKTAKTAGSSIEIALSKICGPNDIITYRDKEEYSADSSNTIRQNVNIPFKYYSKKDWRKLLRERKRKHYKGHDPASRIVQNVDERIWDNYYKFCFERNPYDKFISWYYWCGGLNRFSTMKNFILS